MVVEADDIEGAFGPADWLGHGPAAVTAASVVAGWALDPGRTEAELAAVRVFLGLWPDDPQVEARLRP